VVAVSGGWSSVVGGWVAVCFWGALRAQHKNRNKSAVVICRTPCCRGASGGEWPVGSMVEGGPWCASCCARASQRASGPLESCPRKDACLHSFLARARATKDQALGSPALGHGFCWRNAPHHTTLAWRGR